ncbi:hypothetical protein PROFUN_16919, partial [Planoprotostelium fungivorum]
RQDGTRHPSVSIASQRRDRDSLRDSLETRPSLQVLTLCPLQLQSCPASPSEFLNGVNTA